MNNIFNLFNMLKGRGGGSATTGNQQSNLINNLLNSQNQNPGNFASMYNNFSNTNNNSAEQNLHSTNFSHNNSTGNPPPHPNLPDYPYGEFPIKYTKHGQEKLKEEFLNKGKNYYNDTFNTFQNTSTNNINNSNQFTPNFSQQNTYEQQPQQPYYPAQQLSNNHHASATNNGLNINTLLPLLSNLNGGADNNDMMKMLLPLLSNKGGGNFNMEELVKLISNKSPDIKKSSLDERTGNSNELPAIDDYKKVN